MRLGNALPLEYAYYVIYYVRIKGKILRLMIINSGNRGAMDSIDL